MEIKIYKVTSQGEPTAVPSQKAEGGQLKKCTVVLQELGGKYEDQYAATLLGAAADSHYAKGDVVAARLRCQVHEYNGNVYQDVTVQDIVKLSVGF